MTRLISVTLTEAAVVERRKTRRLGWRFLKPGDRLTLCRKVMGRKKGDPLVRLAEVEVVSVRREALCAITEEDIQREGVEPIPGRFVNVDHLDAEVRSIGFFGFTGCPLLFATTDGCNTPWACSERGDCPIVQDEP